MPCRCSSFFLSSLPCAPARRLVETFSNRYTPFSALRLVLIGNLKDTLGLSLEALKSYAASASLVDQDHLMRCLVQYYLERTHQAEVDETGPAAPATATATPSAAAKAQAVALAAAAALGGKDYLAAREACSDDDDGDGEKEGDSGDVVVSKGNGVDTADSGSALDQAEGQGTDPVVNADKHQAKNPTSETSEHHLSGGGSGGGRRGAAHHGGIVGAVTEHGSSSFVHTAAELGRVVGVQAYRLQLELIYYEVLHCLQLGEFAQLNKDQELGSFRMYSSGAQQLGAPVQRSTRTKLR